MKLVRSGLRCGVDLGHIAAELGRINATLYFEFLHRVHRRLENIRIKIGIGVFHAVQSVAVEFISHSGDVEALRRAQSTLERGYRGRPGFHRDVGAKGNQRQEVAAVERQLHNALVVNYRADRGVFGVDQGSAAGYLNLLADFADLHDKINTHGGIDLEFHSFARGDLEAGAFGCYIVDARNQIRGIIGARGVGIHLPGLVGGGVRDGHRDAHNHSPAGIGDRARDFSAVLRQRRQGRRRQ